MDFAVGPRAAEAGYRVRIYDRLDSTNGEAMRLARAGERGPVWVVTHEQTAGRGRRGRDWISFPGNLAASLLIHVNLTPPEAAKLGFVAGLAAWQACSGCAPGLAFALKWPNDLLANGGKVAGLLLESEGQGDTGGLAVVIGFGVNIAAAPEGMAHPAVSLAGLGHPIAAEAVFTGLTDAFVRYDSLWDQGRGFDEIRRLWLERAHGIGNAVSVRMGDRIENGVFETLDGQGRLILRTPDGAQSAISAGDVYFGDAATVHDGAGAAH